MASPKISSAQQRKIEVLISSWKGKLTWGFLVNIIELELDIKTTRQTLCTYSGIAASFKNQKSKLRGVTTELTKLITQSDVNLLDKVARLESEIKILKRNNSQQIRMIERILSNARVLPNLDLAELLKERPEDH
jgi:hypothetical protein